MLGDLFLRSLSLSFSLYIPISPSFSTMHVFFGFCFPDSQNFDILLLLRRFLHILSTLLLLLAY